MQNPNEDTEWNDILRSKGIIPPKKEKEISEDQIVSMLEETIEKKTQSRSPKLWIEYLTQVTAHPNVAGKQLEDLDLDELDELEDSEDEAVLLEYRQKRIAEIKALADRSKFGYVGEISAQDYVNEVNKAGKDIWVVLHLYKQGWVTPNHKKTINSLKITAYPCVPL